MSSRLPAAFFHHRVSTKDLRAWEERGMHPREALPALLPQDPWSQPEGHRVLPLVGPVFYSSTRRGGEQQD